MTRLLLLLLLTAVFILEGTILSWLLPEWWQSYRVFVAPHFILVVILFIGLFLDRHLALVFGLIFGLLHDFIYYGHMLGTYSFAMGLTGYLAGLLQRKQPNLIFYNLSMIVIGQLLFEVLNFGINRLFSIVNVDFQYAVTHYILPSVLFNLLFALAIYVPMRKLLERLAPLPNGAED